MSDAGTSSAEGDEGRPFDLASLLAVGRSQLFFVAVVAAALSGCAAIDQARQAQAQQDLTVARESCAQRFTDGTSGFAVCVETQLAVISDHRRQALEDQSAPTQVPTYGSSGRLCVPTAAEAGVIC